MFVLRPSGGCTDCHSADSPFYTGIITVDSPLKTDDAMMVDFHSQNLFAAQVFSNAFIFRPWLKGIIYLSVFLILSLLALLFINGLGGNGLIQPNWTRVDSWLN